MISLGSLQIIKEQGRIQLLSKVGVYIRDTITRWVGGIPRKKNNVWEKYSAFPVNLTPLSRNNFVLWVDALYIIFQGGVGGGGVCVFKPPDPPTPRIR